MATNLHEQRLGSEGDVDDSAEVTETLLAHATNQHSEVPPSDLAKILSTTISKYQGKPGNKGTGKGQPSNKGSGKGQTSVSLAEQEWVNINGVNFTREVNVHCTYSVSAHKSEYHGSLVDRGANGGIAGSDVCIIEKTTRKVDVQGIDDHQVNDIVIATVGGVIETQRGPVIAVLNQYAYTGKGKSIHSCIQLEHFKNDVNDKSVKVPGSLQQIQTTDGYVIPLDIKNGLPYLKIRPYTDEEFDTLPSVILTSDSTWDPLVLDHNLSDDEQWFDAVSDLQDDPTTNLFDEFGNYRKRVVVQDCEFFDALDELPTLESEVDYCVMYHTLESLHQTTDELHTSESLYQVNEGNTWNPKASEKTVTSKEPDYNVLRPMFGFLPVDIIKKTFQKTTQYARIPMSTVLKKLYKAVNPAMNIPRREEPVATDTVYADTPAVDSGATSAQLFVGTKSLVLDVEGMKSDKEFINTLEDNVHQRGAMSKLISDRAQVEISKKVLDYLRALVIGNWQSEPYQQHQNPTECCYQQAKTMMNTIMDRTGSPAYLWLLCLMYVCFILNYTYNESIKAVPMQVLTGSTVDISPLLRFRFREKVYYKIDDSDFPSDSREELGWFVGVSESVGHPMTCKILTMDTNKILYHGNVRSAEDSEHANLRVDPLNQNPPKIIKSKSDCSDSTSDRSHMDGEVPADGESTDQGKGGSSMPVFDPSDLVGRTFLMNPQEDGQRFRARIVQALEDHEADLEKNPTRIKFVCSVNDDQFEEVLAYNEVLDHIQRDEDSDIVWKF